MTALMRLLARLTTHLENRHRHTALMAAIADTHRPAIRTHRRSSK